MRYELDGGYYMYPTGAVFNRHGTLLKRKYTSDGDALIRFYINGGKEICRSLKYLMADAYIEPDPLRSYVHQRDKGNDFSVNNLYRSMWR